MRLTNEEIQSICKKYNVESLWSFSRYDSWFNNKYEWFLKYIVKETPKGESSPYGALGTAAHDIIDKWYSNEIKEEDMADEFENEFVCNIDMLDLKFNRSDEEANKKLKVKYLENLMHFFKHAQKLPYNLVTEKPIIIKVADGIVFHGYIDGIYKDENDTYNILDFKTSTRFTGENLKQHSKQLVIYAEGVHQLGVPRDKIKISFEFLKYVTVKYQQVKGDWKETIIERREIGSKLQAKAKVWLKKLGYEDEIDELLNQMLVDNSIDCLPDDVKAKFDITDCYVEVENWQGLWENLKEEIIETIGEIEEKKKQYEETGDETIFYSTDEELKAASYYLSQLSDYSIPQLKDYANYLERQEAERESNNDLLGTGKKLQEDNELSWLDEI